MSRGGTMGRLKPMPPRLKPMPPRLTYAQGDTPKARLERNPLRALYNSAKWKALRWDVLAAARFTCAMCGRLEADTSKLVCDHIEAHRGDVGLFWNRANLQCLCKTCHDGDKQRAEQRLGWGG